MFFPSRIATKREHRFLIGDRVFFASLPYFDFLPPTETARLRAPQHSRERAREKHSDRQRQAPTKDKERTRYSYFLRRLFPFGSLAALSTLPVLARFYDDAQRHEGAASEPEKNYRPIAEVARMLLGVAYELLSPVILILYSFSPPRGTTELDLGGRRSRLDVHEDGDASICSLLTHDEPMLTCNPCSLATHEGAEQPMPMRRAIPRSAHFCP